MRISFEREIYHVYYDDLDYSIRLLEGLPVLVVKGDESKIWRRHTYQASRINDEYLVNILYNPTEMYDFVCRSAVGGEVLFVSPEIKPVIRTIEVLKRYFIVSPELTHIYEFATSNTIYFSDVYLPSYVSREKLERILAEVEKLLLRIPAVLDVKVVNISKRMKHWSLDIEVAYDLDYVYPFRIYVKPIDVESFARRVELVVNRLKSNLPLDETQFLNELRKYFWIARTVNYVFESSGWEERGSFDVYIFPRDIISRELFKVLRIIAYDWVEHGGTYLYFVSLHFNIPVVCIGCRYEKECYHVDDEIECETKITEVYVSQPYSTVEVRI